MNNKLEDFPVYSVLKMAWHAKIALQITKFPRSINQIPGDFQYFKAQFQIQEIFRSCRHSDPAHAAGPNNNHISKWTTKVRENN